MESEIRDSLSNVHIIDPELIVLDDFADVEVEPEFIEFNKQQKDIIESALRGPPDQVRIYKIFLIYYLIANIIDFIHCSDINY